MEAQCADPTRESTTTTQKDEGSESAKEKAHWFQILKIADLESSLEELVADGWLLAIHLREQFPFIPEKATHRNWWG